jgi:hypothetical protein
VLCFVLAAGSRDAAPAGQAGHLVLRTSSTGDHFAAGLADRLGAVGDLLLSLGLLVAVYNCFTGLSDIYRSFAR